jgi:O-antigen/teichoic acid export membrane protein
VVATGELFILIAKTYTLFPKVKSGPVVASQWTQLRSVLRFSLSIAFTSSVWVFVTQTDKLVLSKVLPLAEYARFTLAVLVASGVMVISGPISGALLPRLTKLAAESDESGLIGLYRGATQLVCAIALPAALVLAFFPHQVLWAWTGDSEIAQNVAPVLRLYALGNGILALGAFPYYLQFAKGDLKLHLIGNVFFVLLLIPSLVVATSQFGMIGAGYAWLTANAAYFLLWVPAVHRRLAAGLHAKWLICDVGVPALASVVTVALASIVVHWSDGRLSVGAEVCAVGFVTLVLALLSTDQARARLIQKWRPIG